MNPQPIILLDNLSRRYGSKLALDHVSLCVPPGVVLGLVGANGAGKTTLIKHVLGLLRAREGQARVFGLDPVARPVEVLSRIGYLSEERDLPPWMSIGELMRYSPAFYPRWDAAYAESLRQEFHLDRASVIRTLSKGELAKAGLLVALAHRPELLVLDEPSSGLDPIVRRELLEAVVRSVVREGRTVLFSSHLLDEIARVSDCVAMLVQGRLVLSGRLDQIIEHHHKWMIRLPASASAAPRIRGALAVFGGPAEWTVICNAGQDACREHLTTLHAQILAESPASFEEIFHAQAGHAAAA
jgi:ABC-2 type transport system ATP-binding protein